MSRQRLLDLIDDGLSTRAIGAHLGLSPTSVRYWISRYGLVTRYAAKRDSVARSRSMGSAEVEGLTTHRARADSGVSCLRCRSESVVRRRRQIKQKLVEEAGGRCMLCGYSRSHAALVFHHIDPTRKSFGMAHGGCTRSLARAREEARKCLLLCANCHAEVEAGAVVLPPFPEQGDPG